MSWSSVDLASQCLADTERTQRLIAAIEATVSGNHTVLDVGTGTGILAIAAAKNTAKTVHAVEIDRDVSVFLGRAGRHLPKNIQIHREDAATISGNRFDVVIIELLDIWLLCEEMAQVLRGLHENGAIDQSSAIIPRAYSFGFEMGYCDFNWSGENIVFPYYQWPFYSGAGWSLPAFLPICAFPSIALVGFHEIACGTVIGIHEQVTVPPSVEKSAGKVNAIRLFGDIHLGNNSSIQATNALNASVVVPMMNECDVGPGSKVDIEAEFGAGLSSVKLMVDGRLLTISEDQ